MEAVHTLEPCAVTDILRRAWGGVGGVYHRVWTHHLPLFKGHAVKKKKSIETFRGVSTQKSTAFIRE